MFGPLLASLGEVLQPQYLFPLVVGTLAGLIGGALPGVTITMTIIIVLPFTFGLDPLAGLAAMVGVYVGGETGGLVTASLLGIPGTPSAVATTFDGFPMARKGEPGRAVWLGTWASFFAGILGAVFLVAATVPLARFALQFGPWEYFALFIFALSMVAGLTEASLLKGFLSGAIGLVITVIGSDPIMSVPRFTFGTDFLRAGFQFLPVLIGIFAFAQIMSDLEHLAAGRPALRVHTPSLAVSHLAVVGDILKRPFLLLWSTLIGLLIGVLPAIGGSAANVMAYDQAKKFSRHPEKFGTGIPEGIIAAEGSNNANVAGSLVTIMAFGIPGDAVTAVMLGAMIIHGIQPGPLFMSQEPRVAYGIFAAYLLAHPVMMVLQWLLARVYLRIVRVPRAVLVPNILVLCVIGAYALNNTVDNVWALLIFGVLGYLLVKLGIPLAPLILGVILGDQIEVNLVRSLMTDADPWLFLTRPISGGMLVLAVLSVAVALWQHRRQQRRAAAGPTEVPDTDF
ncbi:MAG TPA: tripartite tricarboxylate transporter permease [Methylomirabilota bacterium]|nr:tripartite tricarboxylate transporter permease [Methylomirabilota bacterium]